MRDTGNRETLHRAFWSLLTVALLNASSALAAGASPKPALDGRVLGNSKPQPEANVYLYEVASRAVRKVLTSDDGRYFFDALPSGVYKVIAFKKGFIPAVELLLRRDSETRQSLELRMTGEMAFDVRTAEDYWAVRSRIPPDVLREISGLELAAAAAPSAPSLTIPDATRFEARMAALGGIAQMGEGMGEAQVAGAQIGVTGSLGRVGVDVSGHYEQISSRSPALQTLEGQTASGEARSVSVQLTPSTDSQLSLVGTSGELASVRDGVRTPVDLDNYHVGWTGRTGEKAHSSVSAQYIQENNFYQPGWIDVAELPDASQTWKLEGSYARELSSNTSLKTGLRYHQRRGATELDPAGFASDTVGLFGLVDSRLSSHVLIEYGLFSKMSDGALSLMPHGGVVVDLGSGWALRGMASERVDASEAEKDPSRFGRFTSAFYSDGTTCQDVAQSCYEVWLTHRKGEDSSVSLGAIHRKYAETLRLYFSSDFFNRLESLMMVRGDTVPEVRLSLVHRIAPRILAKLESSYGNGGGGILYATDDRIYENQVRYLVTSLDTRFQRTATGVFISFQHLEQALDGDRQPDMELQRLQLMLTQDLKILADLAPNWAVSLNVELSRGSNPYTLTPDDEMRKKLTGGLSVSF